MAWKRMRGYTLIELIAGIVIVGILYAFGLPAMHNLIISLRVHGTASELEAALHYARSEAISRHARVRMCASTDGAACATQNQDHWETGWIIHTIGTDDDPEEVLRVYDSAKHVTIRGVERLTYSAQGRPDARTFIICSENTPPRVKVKLSRLGRIRREKDTSEFDADSCAP